MHTPGFADDPRLAEAKARPISEIVNLLDLHGLKRMGHEMVGPCPDCGGTDRFGVNLRKGLFQCRVCGIKGDGLALVMAVRHLDFRAALTWLCGDAEISPAERAERLAKAREAHARAEAKAAKFRADSIAAARSIWREGLSPEGTAVEAYLKRRSIDISAIGGFPAGIRFHPALRYTAGEGRERRVIHTGPAMLAAIQDPLGTFSGVHRTWLDLTQAKGKARILDASTGQVCDAKKVLGSKKGGAIRLTGSFQSTVMVCGEGLETTWSAMASAAQPDAAFWCLVDLGNMSGRQQSGPGLRHAGMPDLDDVEAFVPPAWVERMIYVMDGDSDPKPTRSKLVAGLRRAMALRPGLQGQIAAAPNGQDLNDVLMGVP
jgi:hypothetical protein